MREKAEAFFEGQGQVFWREEAFAAHQPILRLSLRPKRWFTFLNVFLGWPQAFTPYLVGKSSTFDCFSNRLLLRKCFSLLQISVGFPRSIALQAFTPNRTMGLVESRQLSCVPKENQTNLKNSKSVSPLSQIWRFLQ